MSEQSLKINDSFIYYEIIENEASITGAARLGSDLSLPEYIEGFPVTSIKKKALLGQRSLRHIALAQSIKHVEQWAFAQCTNLETFVAQANSQEFVLDKGVFTGSNRISDICVGSAEKSDFSALLATTAYKLEADYLLCDLTRGNTEWFQKWDKKLQSYLQENDEDGYMKLALCGEEDIMLNIPEFISEKRRKKAELCLIRLKHDTQLAEDMRQCFTAYLLDKTKSCKTEEAWQVLLQNFASDITYIEMFADLGGIYEENLDDALLSLGDDFAEVKAFLIRYKDTHFEKKDIFDSFKL